MSHVFQLDVFQPLVFQQDIDPHVFQCGVFQPDVFQNTCQVTPTPEPEVVVTESQPAGAPLFPGAWSIWFQLDKGELPEFLLGLTGEQQDEYRRLFRKLKMYEEHLFETGSAKAEMRVKEIREKLGAFRWLVH